MSFGDVVGSAHAGKDPIDQCDFRVARRHERADLRHHAQERGLTQVGRFPAHVRPGENHQLAGRSVERDVVGDERFACRRGPAFDDGMPCIRDDHFVAFVDVRLRVVVDGRGLRQRGQHIQRGERTRRRLNARRLSGHGAAQRFEQAQFQLEDALVGTKHFLFVLFQRGRDEALAAGNRLFAMVVGRNGVKIRFRNLDVIPEHAVVSHLQRTDAGARAFALFHLDNHLLAGSADGPQRVEIRVDAVTRESAVARKHRRIVDERRFNQLPDVCQIVE